MEPPSTYKIVKTREGKNRSLALIPASWEVDGVLSWPKLKSDTKVNNYIKNCIPPGTTAGVEWIKCATKVVETNILSYDAGNTKLSALLKQQDSSSSTTDAEEMVSTKRRRTTKINLGEKNYSALFLKVNKTPYLTYKIYYPNKLIRNRTFFYNRNSR